MSSVLASGIEMKQNVKNIKLSHCIIWQVLIAHAVLKSANPFVPDVFLILQKSKQ